MIPLKTCQVCQRNAQFLCHHPDCEADPFLCMSTCVNNASKFIHIHLQRQKSTIIGFQDLLQRINTIQQGPYKTYFKDNMKSFNETVSAVKRIFDTQKNTLQQKQYNLSEWIKPKIEALRRKTGTPLFGKQINMIINGKDIYTNFNQYKWNNSTSKLQKFKKAIDTLVKNYYEQADSNKIFNQFPINTKPYNRLKNNNFNYKMKYNTRQYQEFDYCNKGQFSNRQNDQSDSMNSFINDEGVQEEKPCKTFQYASQQKPFFIQKDKFNGNNIKSLLKIAQKYHDDEDFIKAQEYYDKCISMNSNCFQALNGKGVLKLDQSNFHEALNIFNRLIDGISTIQDQDLIDSDYYYNRALTLFQLHNYPDSLSNLKSAIKFIKSSKQKGDYFHLRSKIYLNQSKYSEALTQCDEAIMRLQDVFSHPQYYKTRGQTYKALDMQGKAQDDFQMMTLIEKKQQQQQQMQIKGWRRFD